MIKVKLIAHTPEPEKTVAMAAKLCYSPVGIDDISDGLNKETTTKFLNMLTDIGHASPIEHVTFTFGIEGISRACSHQLVRHRIASYSQQSQRYVDGENFDFVVPPEIQKNEKALTIYEKAIETSAKAYKEVRNSLVVGYISDFLGKSQDGTNEEIMERFKKTDKKHYSAFLKKANEDARFILPNASTTKIICTFNARSLQNFFTLRCCNRAQWEIREVADQMLALCKQVAPTLFKNAGPNCARGACSEGAMSCGQAKIMRKKYEDMS